MSNLTFTADGNDLVIGSVGSAYELTVDNFFLGGGCDVEYLADSTQTVYFL